MTGYLLSMSVPVLNNWFSQTIHTCKALVVYLGWGGGGALYFKAHLACHDIQMPVGRSRNSIKLKQGTDITISVEWGVKLNMNVVD